jgi:hypothetical protein
MILRLEITKLSYIESVIYVLILLHIILINGNKWVDIGYNMNYMKIFK